MNKETIEKIVEAYYRPHSQDHRYYDLDSLASALREIVNELQYYQCSNNSDVEDMVVDARDLYELANELENI
jgi:hypothetical protein